ncbi:MAG: FkbM family methyltransferase [Pseudanabaenaceae cyanobacterium]
MAIHTGEGTSVVPHNRRSYLSGCLNPSLCKPPKRVFFGPWLLLDKPRCSSGDRRLQPSDRWLGGSSLRVFGDEIDVQGAEGQVLRGARHLLTHTAAIQLEVNYAEMYTGCPLIDDLDHFLEPLGFERVAVTTPFHHTWGDALYVRRETPLPAVSSEGENQEQA